VLLVERSGSTLRIFIDHPEGVSSRSASASRTRSADLRESYALEVSSPGPKRPLTKPEHFQRFVGRRARVRIAGEESASVIGELIGATGDEVTLAAPEGIVAIPYAAIKRSHLVEE
jgi:ribosome maturation factor RimP